MRKRVALAVTILAVSSVVWATPLPQSVVGRPASLLANGGFDVAEGASLPVGWTVEGNTAGVKIVNRKADRTAGLASLELTDTDTNFGLLVRSRKMVGVAGGQYMATVKTKTKSGTGGALYLEFWSFEGRRLAETHASAPAMSAGVATTQPGAEFQTITLSAVAPENTAHVTIAISSMKDATGVTCWDEADVRLEPAAYDPAIGTARELFLDDHRIESAQFVGRVVHPAKTNPLPVLKIDKPWEESAYIYGSVFKVGDTYRMWYTAYTDVEPHYFNGYAESKDGLKWEKPNLNLIEYKGSKANNLLHTHGNVAYNPDAPADRKYVSLGFKGGKPNDTLGYYISFSPDGYTFTQQGEKPALLDGDVSNINYDPVKKLYIATIKKRMFTARTPGVYERAVFVSSSPDAITWTPPRLAIMGDYADDGYAESLGGLEAQIYGMPLQRYESTYVGFPWMLYITNYLEGVSAGAGDGPVDVQIASSRDLIHWTRPVRDKVIHPGRPGSWNDGCTYTATNFLVDDEKIYMYYGAFNAGHGGSDPKDPTRPTNKGQSGLAMWRRDGWVSITNGATKEAGDPGQLVTKALKLSGTTLHVNATVRPGGELTVEVLGADGTPLPGFEAAKLEGDALNHTVKFSSGKSLADLKDQKVKLRFKLTDVDLYSYWVTPE